jgi:hypothetical protein
VKKVYTGTFDVTADGDEVVSWSVENSCVGAPGNTVKNQKYHYKHFIAPEVTLASPPAIMLYTKSVTGIIEPLPVAGDQWSSVSTYLADGGVYAMFKSMTEYCDGSATVDWYDMSGEYKLIILN